MSHLSQMSFKPFLRIASFITIICFSFSNVSFAFAGRDTIRKESVSQGSVLPELIEDLKTPKPPIGGGIKGVVLLALAATSLLTTPGYTDGVPVGQPISPPAVTGQLLPGAELGLPLGSAQEERAPAIIIPSDAGWKAEDWVDSRAIEQVIADRNQIVMSVRLYSESNFRKQLGEYLKKNPIAGFNPDNYREITDLVGALSAKVEAIPSAPQRLHEILEMGERTKGEAFIDLRYDDYGIPGWNRGSGVDLSKYKIQVTLEIPAGLPGANNAPNGVQIFLKSGGDWAGWYGGWTNIDSSGKMTVAIDVKGTVPNWVVPGFDPSDCVGLGVKLGTGGNAPSDHQFQGQVKILEVKLIPSTISNLVSTPAPLPKITLQPVPMDTFITHTGRNLNWGEETPYGTAVGSEDGYSKIMPNGKTRIYNALAKVKAEGGRAARVWLFMDLRNWESCTEVKNGKRVFKPQVYKDIQAVVDAQKELGIEVMPSLFDFHILNGIRVERGIPVGEHSEFFTEKGLPLFIETLRPVIQKFASQFACIDLMNEPENTAPEAGSNVAFNPHVLNFLRAIDSEIDNAGGKSTIGAAKPQDLAKYRDFIEVGQVHRYGGELPNAGALGVGNMEVVVGEIDARTPGEVSRDIEEAHRKGYKGVLFWDQDGFTGKGIKDGVNSLLKKEKPGQPQVQQLKPAVTSSKASIAPEKTEVTQPQTQETEVIEIDPTKFTVQGDEFYLDVSYGIDGLPSVSGERSGVDLRGYDLEFAFKDGSGRRAQIFLKNSSFANVYSYPRAIIPNQPIRYNPSDKAGRNVNNFDDFSHIHAIGAKIFGGTEGLEIIKVRLIKRSDSKHSQVIPQNKQREKFAQLQNYLKSAAQNYADLNRKINSNPELVKNAEMQAELKYLETQIDYWAQECLEVGEKAGMLESDLNDLVNVVKSAAQLGITLSDYVRVMAYWSAKSNVAPYVGKPAWITVTGDAATVSVEGKTVGTVVLNEGQFAPTAVAEALDAALAISSVSSQRYELTTTQPRLSLAVAGGLVPGSESEKIVSTANQNPAPKDILSQTPPEEVSPRNEEALPETTVAFSTLLAELKERTDYYNALAAILRGLKGQKIELIIDRSVLGLAITEAQVKPLIQAIKNGGIDLIVNFDNSSNQTDRARVYLTSSIENYSPEHVKQDRVIVINSLTSSNQIGVLHQAIFVALGLRNLNIGDVTEQNEKAQAVINLYNSLNPLPEQLTFEGIATLITPPDLTTLKDLLRKIIVSLPVPEAITDEQVRVLYQEIEEAVRNI